MNPALIAAMLALAGIGGATAVALDCHDLAGQGHLCAEIDESGAELELVLDPALLLASAAECHDLAGLGEACAEIDEHGADVDITIDPQQTRASSECQPIESLGEVCHDLGEESGSVSWDLEQEDLGFDSEGELEYQL